MRGERLRRVCYVARYGHGLFGEAMRYGIVRLKLLLDAFDSKDPSKRKRRSWYPIEVRFFVVTDRNSYEFRYGAVQVVPDPGAAVEFMPAELRDKRIQSVRGMDVDLDEGDVVIVLDDGTSILYRYLWFDPWEWVSYPTVSFDDAETTALTTEGTHEIDVLRPD